MQLNLRAGLAAAVLILGSAASALADEPPGATVQSLLQLAQERNPEFSAMRLEASAASERVLRAGALMDPRV